jgi:hypothetical protein
MHAIMSAFGHLVDGVAPAPLQAAAAGAQIGSKVPVHHNGIGWDRPEHGNAPYGYVNLDKSGYGLDYGFGLRGHNPVLNTDSDSMFFNGSAGLFEDKKGNTRGGVKFSAGESKVTGEAGPTEGDLGVGTASFDWNAGTDGLSLGGGVNAVEGSGKVSHLPFGSKLRVGGGVGEGLGVRLHWGKDDNGQRDIGFGEDVLDGSFDYTTQGPSRLWNWLFR